MTTILNTGYEYEFNQLKYDGRYEYFITGCPTHKRWAGVAKGDTLSELWSDLMDMGEIDEESLERNYGYTDEEGEFQIRDFDLDYDFIERYLSDSNNFYYRKFSWLDTVTLDTTVEDLLDKEMLTAEELEELFGSADIKTWSLVGNSKKHDNCNWYRITDINGEEYDVYEKIDNRG